MFKLLGKKNVNNFMLNFCFVVYLDLCNTLNKVASSGRMALTCTSGSSGRGSTSKSEKLILKYSAS